MGKYKKLHQKILDEIDSGKRVSPLKAIRAYCLECLGFSAEGVRNCTANNKGERCPLYKFRLGANRTGQEKKF